MSTLLIKMTGPVFRMHCRVIYGDTDAGGVVYNANYLRYFEMGRTEMMRERQIPGSLIEDEALRIRVLDLPSLIEVKKVSCRFNYRILREEKDKEQLLVKGFTVHACVSREGKLTPFPEDILNTMQRLCQD